MKENECFNYFKKKIYKKDTIVNNYVKGDYFEASAKFGLLKFKLPKNKNAQIVTLKEIVSMDTIIEKNDIIEDYKYEEDYLKEEKENKDKDKYDDLNNDINNSDGENEIKEKFDEIKEPIDIDEKKDKNEEVENSDNEENEIESEEEESEEKEEKEDNDEENGLYGEDTENVECENKNENVDSNCNLEKMLEEFKIELKNEEFKQEGLSDEAIAYSKNIEDYRNDEIVKQQHKKEKTIKKSNYYTGDESLFLDQFSKWGKTLDFAYLYGSREKKTFIGFQMKCYFQNSDLSDDAVDRCKIRKNCQQILVNSMKLFNCKIIKWYYYLIFYYNSKIKEENIKHKNITKCENNDISYIFYEPIKKKFYSGKKIKKTVMKKFTLKKKANLDAYVTNVSKFSYDIVKEGKIKMGAETKEMKKQFINDFSKVFLLEQNVSILELLDKIQTNLKLKNVNIYFHSKCKFNKYYFCPPNNDFIFLYKIKNEEDYIAVFIQNRIVTFIKVSTGEEKNSIFDLLDINIDYYYCLKKLKKNKAKRMKMDYKIEIKSEKIPNIQNGNN